MRVCERVKARQGPRQKRIGGANKPDVIYLQRLMTEADKQGAQQQLQDVDRCIYVSMYCVSRMRRCETFVNGSSAR